MFARRSTILRAANLAHGRHDRLRECREANDLGCQPRGAALGNYPSGEAPQWTVMNSESQPAETRPSRCLLPDGKRSGSPTASSLSPSPSWRREHPAL